MLVTYNITDRKPFVKALERVLGQKAVYLKTPTYAYQVGPFTLTREGNLETDKTTDKRIVFDTVAKLKEYGFYDESVRLTVSLPRRFVDKQNLDNLLSAKGDLIKKALNVESLEYSINDECVTFPWFKEPLDSDTSAAYTNFISAVCKMTKDQKRINPQAKKADNEKYAFRCFLLRLGFVGARYKLDRHILLKNLSGSSAFKSR